MNKVPFDKCPHDRAKHAGRYVLLTGATGLVGQFLVRDLIQAGVHLAVLVRSSRKLNAVDRMEAIMQRWEAEQNDELARPVVIEGDVTQADLGLKPSDTTWIRENCHAIIHNAATVQFEIDPETNEPWRSNHDGTQHVIRLAKSIPESAFHYVSTAYVCGQRDGTIKEDEFDCGQAFRNAYEESKFHAERVVREQLPAARTSIYRPTIIAGDSRTGFTVSYHGLMWYLRLLDILVPQQPKTPDGKYETSISLPVAGDEPHNIVTVDYVSRAISELIQNPESLGNTFHLAADRPTTYRGVIDCCYRIFNSAGVSYQGTSGNGDRPAANNAFASTFFEQSKVYQSYAVCHSHFDKSNLEQFLPNLECPVIDDETIRRYMEFGRTDRWGKRSEKRPVVTTRVNETIENFVSRLALDGGESIGLDIVGTGGRQLTISKAADGELTVERGISGSSNETIRISSSELGTKSNPAFVQSLTRDFKSGTNVTHA